MSPVASDKPFVGSHSRTRHGFSLVEVLLVIGLLAIVMTATLPFFGNFLNRERETSVTQDLLDTLRRAQHRSLTGEDSQTWGVRVLSGSFVLYAGSTYVARDVNADEVHPISSVYTLSGITDAHFSTRGVPQMSGIITISRTGIDAQTIELNTAGGIFLQSQ